MKSKKANRCRLWRYLLPLLVLLLPVTLGAQDTLRLEECYRLTEKNYPMAAQPGLFDQASRMRTENLGKNWLPQFNVTGSASYQSAVTRIDLDLPKGFPAIDFPSPKKDMYKLTLDASQAIYDGRATRRQKELETFSLQTDRQSVEVEMYKLRDRVNQVYFGLLMLDKSERLVRSNRDRIDAKLSEVRSGIGNGSLPAMNEDLLLVERVRLDQQLAETAADREASFRVLSELTGTKIIAATPLAMPSPVLPDTVFEDKRPEMKLFDIQRQRTVAMSDLVTVKWNPKVFAFGQAGYGRPGLNMLDDGFTPWWMVGAKVTWTPWNWNQNRNEKKILTVQEQILKSQQETFDRNVRIGAARELGEVMKYAGLLAHDGEIVALREKIAKAASSMLDNGVINSSDYIARLTEETQARLNLEIHKIQMVKAKMNYLFTLGK